MFVVDCLLVVLHVFVNVLLLYMFSYLVVNYLV